MVLRSIPRKWDFPSPWLTASSQTPSWSQDMTLESRVCVIKKVPLTVLRNFYLYICCFGALACKLSRCVRVWANGADSNKGCVHLAFLTYQWNAVNSIVTSFLAPNCEFRGKWNAAEEVKSRGKGKQRVKKNHINQIGFNKRSCFFFLLVLSRSRLPLGRVKTCLLHNRPLT